MDSSGIVLRAPQSYNRLTPIIQNVNREVIAIKKELKVTTGKAMNQVVNYVVRKLMQVDKAFTAIYRGKRRVGSFFDNTKVNEPTEFDVYLILPFPFQKKCELRHSDPGFVQVCAKSAIGRAKNGRHGGYVGRTARSTLNQIFDSAGFIRRDKVMDWWQSIFAQAMPTGSPHLAIIDGKKYYLKWSTSCSGIQVHVLSENGEFTRMRIDMVPVLRFKGFEYFSQCPQTSSLLEGIDDEECPKHWYIFPKPRMHTDTDRMNLLWGLSFWDQEKMIMHLKDHMKPVNRLMKRLRDNYAWKPLTSYYIKTLFLREILSGEVQLYRNNLGYLFVYFLTELETVLEEKKLENFWNMHMNLLQDISPVTLNDWRGCISRIVKKIHSHLDRGDTAQLEIYVRKLFIGGPGALESSPSIPTIPTRPSIQVPSNSNSSTRRINESRTLSPRLHSEHSGQMSRVGNPLQAHLKSTPLSPVRPFSNSQRNYNTRGSCGRFNTATPYLPEYQRLSPCKKPEPKTYTPTHTLMHRCREDSVSQGHRLSFDELLPGMSDAELQHVLRCLRLLQRMRYAELEQRMRYAELEQRMRYAELEQRNYTYITESVTFVPQEPANGSNFWLYSWIGLGVISGIALLMKG